MIKKILPFIPLAVIAISLAVILYWIYSPPKQVLEIEQPIKVVTKSARPGEYILLNSTFCKKIKSEGRMIRSLIGESTQLALPVTTESSPKGCQENLVFPMAVPELAPPGQYHFYFRVTYQINPLTSITQDIHTESFTVTE